MVNQDGDRELMFTLEAGQSYTATTLEKTYWFATMNRETDEGKKFIFVVVIEVVIVFVVVLHWWKPWRVETFTILRIFWTRGHSEIFIKNIE